MKMGIKHNFDQWQHSMARIRKEFPKEIEKSVDKSTQKILRGAKQSVPIRDHMLKAMIRAERRGMTGEIIAGTHYAPYMEYGTGNKVNVPNELTAYARQFKGRGIRQVNIDPRPFLYPHFFIQRYRFMEELKQKLKMVSKREMIKRRGGALRR